MDASRRLFATDRNSAMSQNFAASNPSLYLRIIMTRQVAPGQMFLCPYEVRTRTKILTHNLYSDELRAKLPKNHQRKQITHELNRSARSGHIYEVATSEGLWLAKPVGKTETERWVWDLYFRPNPQMIA